MRDEADLRGHGFTYEGSKPGAIVQGLIKMGIMNGMFIMDEADKTEKFAIATLLEILDPEQNHLSSCHTETTPSILCHFVQPYAETIPPPRISEAIAVLERKITAWQNHPAGIRDRENDASSIRLGRPNCSGHLNKTYTCEAGGELGDPPTLFCDPARRSLPGANTASR
jgi:ATP-dependent Lon protease